jgi:hypothetical protein
VAFGPGHDDQQHVGHTKHGEGWRQPGVAAVRQVRQQTARVGPSPTTACAGTGSRGGNSRWHWNCAPLTIQRAPTVRRRSPLAEGSLLLDLVLVPRTANRTTERRQWRRAAAVQMVVPPEVVRSTAAAALLPLGLYKLR